MSMRYGLYIRIIEFRQSPADMEAFARFGGRKPLNEEETEDGGISKKVPIIDPQ